nr:hypothetical protein [Paenibacillus larvae]
MREKNRQKVLRAIKELDYCPNSAARSLARGKWRHRVNTDYASGFGF